ncbi:pyrroloquinoline quinone biosynthesis protein PqqE [Limnochorda pilosa]|uniref:PqqA peptide cyclase n=1 Tax=Limnochorda pilosa TaxID=1555112 RepID=A0A0K2SIN8_LIMPI|nr:pyrroloquinoline quinone biosynthesis protein PqqE [Limnochorda pilosa]
MQESEVPSPFSLLAELTHRCPLHCPYCSNPLRLARREEELETGTWLRVLDEARDLGVVQVHFSGGEPLLRRDLEALTARARENGAYVNLITSGVGLDRTRVRRLREAGLDAIQVSVQAARPELSDRIVGRKAWEEKRQAALAVKAEGLPLTLNVVLHRFNLDDLEPIILMAEAWGADRLELANTQYYGWAFLNRERLLPSVEQVARAEEVYRRHAERLHGQMELVWVVPDYHADHPKPCMGGWGRIGLTVSPEGDLLPCPTAGVIADLSFPSVRTWTLARAWRSSEAFNRFRGFQWMPEPCRSCDRRFVDFGGCRCQAYLLTGDAARTDPVCRWSSDHFIVENTVMEARELTHAGVPGTMRGVLRIW